MDAENIRDFYVNFFGKVGPDTGIKFAVLLKPKSKPKIFPLKMEFMKFVQIVSFDTKWIFKINKYKILNLK